MELPCEICTKTNNSCCKADIPFESHTALALILIAEENGLKNISIAPHPKHENRVIVFSKNWIVNGDLDITTRDCVFLKNGKCLVYENRPDICRLYGTKYIRCRYEASNVPPERIKFATLEDIKFLDDEANRKSLVYINSSRIIKN